MSKTVTMTFVDEDLEKGTHEYQIEDADAELEDADLEGLGAALDAMSYATIRQYNILDTDQVIGAPEPVNGPYSVRDKLRLGFLTAAGNAIRFTIPAPIAGVFEGDDVVINEPGSPVRELVTAILGIVRDKGGALAATYTGGTRIRNK